MFIYIFQYLIWVKLEVGKKEETQFEYEIYTRKELSRKLFTMKIS